MFIAISHIFSLSNACNINHCQHKLCHEDTFFTTETAGEMQMSDYLRHSRMTVITNDQCKESYGDVIIDSQICIESDSASACSVSLSWILSVFITQSRWNKMLTKRLCVLQTVKIVVSHEFKNQENALPEYWKKFWSLWFALLLYDYYLHSVKCFKHQLTTKCLSQ